VVTICKCADWLLVAIAASEALEHNASVSRQMENLQAELVGLIPAEKLENMSFRHALLGGYITEGMANFALSGSLGEIERKCEVDISAIKKLKSEGFEAIKRRDAFTAENCFNKIKSELVTVAQNICAENDP